MPESITITDNRSGEAVEIPIAEGGVDAGEWRKLLPNIWFYDEAFMTTAATKSAITEIDGDAGILRYRGYPIEQLAEHSTYLEVAYLLIHGELPTQEQYDPWVRDITYHTFIHENVRKRFLEGFHYDAHPMGMLVSAVAALSTFYLDAKDIADPEVRYKQIVRLIAKLPTLAAACHRFSVGMPFVYPDNSLGFSANFLSMLWKVAEPRYDANPALAKALDVLFILHADHEQNCGTTAMRTVASAHADPYSCVAASTAALYGPRHGGANEAVIKMLTEIGSIDAVDDYVKRVKAGEVKLQGFGHRVYKNYDPRAKIIKQTADEVFDITGRNPLLDIALEARRRRPLRRVLHLSPALPERRLLLRPDLPGHGLPDRDVHGALRHPPGVGLAGALGRAARAGPEDRPPPPALRGRRRARLPADGPARLTPPAPKSEADHECTPSRSSTVTSSGASSPTRCRAPASCSCGCERPACAAATSCRPRACTHLRRAPRPPTSRASSSPVRWRPPGRAAAGSPRATG